MGDDEWLKVLSMEAYRNDLLTSPYAKALVDGTTGEFIWWTPAVERLLGVHPYRISWDSITPDPAQRSRDWEYVRGCIEGRMQSYSMNKTYVVNEKIIPVTIHPIYLGEHSLRGTKKHLFLTRFEMRSHSFETKYWHRDDSEGVRPRALYSLFLELAELSKQRPLAALCILMAVGGVTSSVFSEFLSKAEDIEKLEQTVESLVMIVQSNRVDKATD